MPFKSGSEWKGNKSGRPRVPEIEQLRKAMADVESEKGKSLMRHLVEQSYVDNGVLKAVANKFVPDMTMLSINPESNEIIVKFKDK